MHISVVAGHLAQAPQIIAVILAGGQARRMGGGDKALRMLGQTTLLEFLIPRLRPQCAAIVISANGDPRRFEAYDLPVIPDSTEDASGPLAGILAGMHWTATEHPDATHILSVTADTPFIPDNLASRLASSTQNAPHPIACASSGTRIHAPVALWPLGLKNSLETFMAGEDRKSVQNFASRHGFVAIDWPIIPYDPFFNINTPEDLEKANELVLSGLIID